MSATQTSDGITATIDWARLRRDLKRSLAVPLLDLDRPGLTSAPLAHPLIRIRLDTLLTEQVSTGLLADDDAKLWRRAACLNGVHSILSSEQSEPNPSRRGERDLDQPSAGRPAGQLRRAVERADRALGLIGRRRIDGPGVNAVQTSMLAAIRQAVESSTESRLGDLSELRALFALNPALYPVLALATGKAEQAVVGEPGATLVRCTVRHLSDLIRYADPGPAGCAGCADSGESRLGRSYVRALGLLACHLLAALADPAPAPLQASTTARTSEPPRQVRRRIVLPQSAPTVDPGSIPRSRSGSGPGPDPASAEGLDSCVDSRTSRPSDAESSAIELADQVRGLWSTGQITQMQRAIQPLLARGRELPADDRAEIGQLYSHLLLLIEHPAANRVQLAQLRALSVHGGSARQTLARTLLELQRIVRIAMARPVSAGLLERTARQPNRTARLLAGLPAVHELMNNSRGVGVVANLYDPSANLERQRQLRAAEQLAGMTPEFGTWAAGQHGMLTTLLAARRARSRGMNPGDHILRLARATTEACDRGAALAATSNPRRVALTQPMRIAAVALEGRLAVLAGDREAAGAAVHRMEQYLQNADTMLAGEATALAAVIRERARTTRGWSGVLSESMALPRLTARTQLGIVLPHWLTPRVW